MGLIDTYRMKLAELSVPLRNTIADFISAELQKRHLSNRALALGAGVSESVIRNLLQHGIDPRAKDPDPRTLRAVADYLGINPLILFRLAGYLPPPPNSHSPRADYVAEVFDRLKTDKQDAVLGVLEALTEYEDERIELPKMRMDPDNPFAGFDLYADEILVLVANRLIVETHATSASDFDKPGFIPPNLVLYLVGPRWSDLDERVRQRIVGLAKAKLNLEYGPTMVDPKWRK